MTRRRATRPSTARAEVERFATERDTDARGERRLLALEVAILAGLVLTMGLVRFIGG